MVSEQPAERDLTDSKVEKGAGEEGVAPEVGPDSRADGGEGGENQSNEVCVVILLLLSALASEGCVH